MHNPYTVGCTWLRCTDTTCGPKQFFLLNGLMYLSRIFFIYKVHVAAPVVLADVICNCFSQPPDICVFVQCAPVHVVHADVCNCFSKPSKGAGIPLSLYLYLCLCNVYLLQMLFAVVSANH